MKVVHLLAFYHMLPIYYEAALVSPIALLIENLNNNRMCNITKRERKGWKNLKLKYSEEMQKDWYFNMGLILIYKSCASPSEMGMKSV